jgi:ATP-binding cassette subfamily B protein/subfamily B ATP-binding cassette protein MsbA
MSSDAAPRSRVRALWGIYRTFGPFLRPYWHWFAFGYLAMATAILAKVAAPFPLKWILDYVLLAKPLPEGWAAERLTWLGERVSWLGGDAHGLLALLCGGIVALVFVSGLFTYWHRYLLAGAARMANNDIRNHVFHRLQLLPLSFHGAVRPGDLVVRLTEDMNTLRRLLVDSLTAVFKMFFTFGWIFVLMATIHWKLTLLALIPVLPIYLLARRFTGRVEELARVQRTKESEVGSIIQENLSSMAVVQAYSREDAERERFGREAGESLRADLKRLRLSKGFGRMIEVMSAVGQAGVVYYGGTLALGGELEATSLVLFVPWLKEFYEPLQKLAELLVDVTGQLVSGERIAEIARTEATVRDADDAIAAPPFRGEVRFEHVTFGYRTGRPVLQDLSFTARPGQLVALVGTTGAGKSTVVNLLLRFFDPWQGTVRIDGEDVRRFTLESLRSQMNVVLQDTLLLRRTIGENIAFGKPDATAEEIEAAARAAQIDDFVRSLPEGYGTNLQDQARNLSGGQRQRLALARALLREAPILILDEPVTQVDALTEARLNQTLARVTKGKTAFIVAHRLSTIRRADLILVIEEGTVAESGNHEALMARSSRYRTLYETQYAPLEAVDPGEG